MIAGNIYHYLLYRLKARSKYDIHSPFVYKFYSQVLKDHTQYPCYVELKNRFPSVHKFKYYRLLYRLSRYLNTGKIYFKGQEDGAELSYLSGDFREIELQSGNFNISGPLNLTFIDLEHLEVVENGYFSKLLQHTNQDSVLIIWNLRESGTLRNEWKEIQKNPMVKITIDLFQVGLVFFRDELSKEDFILRF